MSDKLLNWLSSECGESFADDLSTDMQTFMYQNLLDTPDIPKYGTSAARQAYFKSLPRI